LLEILEDKTTTPEMKLFLAPILDKKGPSGKDEVEFSLNFTKASLYILTNKLFHVFFDYNKTIGRDFNIFMHDLWRVCNEPTVESHVKTMVINLCSSIGLNDPQNGLSARLHLLKF
jgi:hypothetical protein